MPYTINKTNGLKIIVVQDGTINTSALDITLVGKNYIGYGEAFNENFVKLLENFANSTRPAKPLAGQLWYDTTVNKLNVYTGVGTVPWKPIGIVNNGTTQPVSATSNIGDLWWDAINKKLFAYNGTEWTIIGPSVVKGSNSGAFAGTILSQNGPPAKSVLFQSINGTPTFVSSTDPLYASDLSDASASLFPRVFTGITFPNTDIKGISVTDISVQNQPKGHILWGTAASSLGLIVASTATSGFSYVDANNFLLRNELASFGNQLSLKDNNGVVIGNPYVMQVHVAPTNVGNVSVFAGSRLNLNVNTSYGTYTTVVSADGANNKLSLLPNATIPTNIGSTLTSFDTGYFGTVIANTLTVKTFLYEQQELDAVYISATKINVATTVTAAVFSGSGAKLTNIPNSAFIASTSTITAGIGLSGGGTVTLGGTITLTNAGVLSMTAGTDTSVSGLTGDIKVWNNSTLQSVTNRGATSNSVIQFTNSTNASSTATGSLQVAGGAGVGKDLYVGGNIYMAGNKVVNVSSVLAGIGIGVTPSQSSGTVAISNSGILSINGTLDQINVSVGTQSPVLSLPQSISPLSFVTFAGVTVNGLLVTTNSVTTPSLTTGATATAGNIIGQWTLGSGSTLQSTYADLAEKYAADRVYTEGMVLVIGGSNEVTTTSIRANVAVAGIVSINPAFKLNCAAGSDDSHPYIALKGRVPCKVIGPVYKGNLLVTSSKPEYAEAFKDGDSPNAVLGIALADMLDNFGVVDVKV
jgi:hypothetical protein